MTLKNDQKLRSKLLNSSLAFFNDPDQAIATASKMERFIVEGPAATDVEDLAAGAEQAREANESVPENESTETRKHARWTEADDADLTKLWNEGIVVDEISSRLGRIPLSTNVRARKLALNGVHCPTVDQNDLAAAVEAPGKCQTVDDPIAAPRPKFDGSNSGKELEARENHLDGAEDEPSEIETDQFAPGFTPAGNFLANKVQECNGINTGSDTATNNGQSKRPQPDSVQSTLGMIVDFLRGCDFTVVRLDDGSYELDGEEVLTADGLVQRANDQRCFLGKPQFKVEVTPAEAL